MKFAEVSCINCGAEFKITFIDELPPSTLFCPICGLKRCKYIKINGD